MTNLFNYRYPVRVQEVDTDDPRSISEHYKAVEEEMKKQKPRDALILPLMKSIFDDRRMFIQNDATNVNEILQIHTVLVRPAMVSVVIRQLY